jgi:hypothetical protein
VDGDALDLDLDDEVTGPQLALAPDDTLHAVLGETTRASERAHALRWNGAQWEPLGPAANDDSSESGSSVGWPSLAVDSRGYPVVAFGAGWAGQTAGLTVRRYNGSRERPYGLLDWSAPSGCVIPEDDEDGAAFPQTLADTGCFSDVAARSPIDGIVGFELNSPLWSDGAAKQRYIVLPPGESLTYTDTGAFGVPVGTILIKEFLLEAVLGDPTTLFPVETRFLVKRCEELVCAEPWQGYSYQWNDQGTEATLLVGAASVTKDWTVGGGDGTSTGAHTHTYPSRAQCVRCHNSTAGRTLGLQAAQLDRSYDYGRAIDHQLRALATAGILGGVTQDDPVALPRPHDPTNSRELRTRSYLQTNCAHCHRQFGEQPSLDLRYVTPLAQTGICGLVTPGNAAGSRLYDKDAATPSAPPATGGGPMPPLAKLTADTDQLIITAAWIDQMASCP